MTFANLQTPADPTRMVPDRARIFETITALLPSLVPDWDFEGWDDAVSEQTRLIADLGLTSVAFVDLFVSLENDLGRSIGFHDLLMVDGRYINDLSLGDLTDFLVERIAAPPSGHQRTASAAGAGTPAAGIPTVDEAVIERFNRIIPSPARHPPPRARNGRVVFLLSAPRSGSTLLQSILAGHPALFAPPELHLLWFSDMEQRRQTFQQASNRHLVSGAIRAVMELEGLDAAQASAVLARCEQERMPVGDFYARLLHRVGRRLLVDKTPSNAYSAAVLSRAEQEFEVPLYLHLVRHPGGMIRSFTDARLERTVPFMMRHADAFTGLQLAELAWLTCNRNISDFLRGIPPTRQHRVHYEDLVNAPGTAVSAICAFLGVPYEPRMLDPYDDKRGRMVDGLATVGQLSGDLKFHLHGRIDAEAAERWRRYLSEDALGEPTWELARRLGYRRGR